MPVRPPAHTRAARSGASMSQASQQRRRGAVFSVRVTDAERAKLEQLQVKHRGPRALGPWMLWRALSDSDALTSSGTTARANGLDGVLQKTDVEALPATSTATRAGTTAAPPPVGSRVILDLCGGSGSWSRPYAAAGYDVRVLTLPDDDVRTWAVPVPLLAGGVWGVLAAPPCDQFSVARNGCDTPRDIRGGLEVVGACLRIVQAVRPRWWALENPVGLLGHYLGAPRDTWEPCDFGDPWTKRTALWGDFALPVRGPFVAPLGGGPLCTKCDPARRKTTWCNSAAHRAETPQGFARAFLRANP